MMIQASLRKMKDYFQSQEDERGANFVVLQEVAFRRLEKHHVTGLMESEQFDGSIIKIMNRVLGYLITEIV